MKEDISDICIVGGGIVGAATFFKLQTAHPDLKITLIEKEDRLAEHQTGNNSGVIHSGLYYKPGSLKARNCVDGRKELVAFAKEFGVAHDICGKVVVAMEESEIPYMNRIFNNGLENKTEGIEIIDEKRIRDIEPLCGGIAGIWVPCTGIIDFRGATEKMVEVGEGLNDNSKALFGYEVTGYAKEGENHVVITQKKRFKCRYLIVCGGLQADRLAKKDGVKSEVSIIPFRGDYYELTDRAMHKVRNLIYPVPNPAFPFLGVHFTRMIHGGVECGPNAVFAFKREGYERTSFSLKDTCESLAFGGTWKLFAKHWKFGLDEQLRAFSKQRFLKTLQRLIPSLELEDIKPGRAGVRAMALGSNGEMLDDFKIEVLGNRIHVINAPSPAATAALAIGNQIRDLADKSFGLKDRAIIRS